MEKRINEQHKKVQAWLEKMFADQEVPQYEINERTVEILYQIALRNEQVESDVELIIKDLEQKSEEYQVEVAYLNRVLSAVGLPLTSLSQSGLTSVKTLGSLVVLLGLKDTKMSSLLLGLTEHNQNIFHIQEMLAAERRLNSKLQTKTRKAVMKSNSLKQSLQVLEEQKTLQKPLVEKRIRENEFFKAKEKEYRKTLTELQDHLKQVGEEPSLHHETLVKKSNDIEELRAEVQQLKVRVDGYNSLPPNVSLAKVKIEEAKRELDKLEEMLSTNIDVMM